MDSRRPEDCCAIGAPLDMTNREISQVITRGRLRSDQEQVGWLRERQDAQAAKQAVSDDEAYRIDRKRHGAVIEGHFFSRAALARILAELG